MLIISSMIVVVLAILIPQVQKIIHPVRYIISDTNMLEIQEAYLESGEVAEETFSIPRGARVTVEQKGETSSTISYNGMTMSVPNENLGESRTESVDFEYVYPRRLVTLRTEKDGALADVVVRKGEKVKVLSALASDLDPETGEIAWFEVEKDGQSYYLSGKAVEMSKEAALATYADDLTYNIVYDPMFGTNWTANAYVNSIDFKGYSQPDWADNPARDDLQGVHISLENLAKYKDDLIALKNETGLNTLVVALKGQNGKLWYESDVPEEFFKNTDSVLEHPIMTKEEVTKLFTELKQNGFYIVGRMETFADSSLALDQPELAIADSNGDPAVYSESYWVSPFQRKVWEYNAALAKEFAEMGVNQVEFDFCRFPDGTILDEEAGTVNLRNTYNESKVSAITGFLYYMREELEPLHVYTAADMYAGPVIEKYDYGIGQYAPAIIAAANIVQPMVYLDSFGSLIPEGMNVQDNAREIIANFTEQILESSDTLPNRARLLFWLQGYFDTSGARIAQEVQGIMDGGLSGWLLWTDTGDIATLQTLKDGMISSTAPQYSTPDSSNQSTQSTAASTDAEAD